VVVMQDGMKKESMKLPCKADDTVENQSFGWTNKMAFGLLLDVHHYFKLTVISDNETKVDHNEDFGGCVLFSCDSFFNPALDCRS
jgi:hypothetical protein